MIDWKICGITDPDDARAAASAGAHAIGVVCYAPDKERAVDVDAARAVLEVVPTNLTKVLLFVDAPIELVRTYAELDPNAWLQFHGREDAKFCQEFGHPYLKALRPQAEGDFANACKFHPEARAIILDSGGGTGTTFDWDLVPARIHRAKPLWLAGGLDASNIAGAIQQTQPSCLDVSSGVCLDDNPLRKDPAKLEKLSTAIAEVEDATV